jgi:hypothetical protein
MINLTLGMILMLIVMSYYSGFFLATIIGFGFSYYLLYAIPPDFNETLKIGK